MTDNKEIAALKQQMAEQKAEIEALKAAQPKPERKSTFVPMSDAEWRDQMHQLAEKRMSIAHPPSMVRDWAVIPEHIVKGIREDRHAPTNATGMISQRAEPGSKSSTPGYVDPRPLLPPPGIGWVDAQLIADEVRQRAELKRKLGE